MKLDTTNNTEDISSLQERIEKLEKMLAEHQHLGFDGSKEFDDHNKIKCNEISVSGVGIQRNLLAVPYFRAYDVDGVGDERRQASMAIGVAGQKGTNKEQNTFTYQVGKGEFRTDSPAEDWSKNNFTQMTLVHRPIGNVLDKLDWLNKYLGVASFLIARRTPIVFGRGVVTGNTLKDMGAKFKTGQTPTRGGNTTGDTLVHGILNLQNEDRAILESNVILEVTENEIICENDFILQGEYNYEVVMPVILGAANNPFSLGYFGDGLVFGYGTRGRNDISSMTWGKGSPEGVIRANVGSLYLRQDGGAGTTLYVKESGKNNQTGWAAK